MKTAAYLWFVCFAIFMPQVFQLALAPLAHDYVSVLTVSGVTEAVKSTCLVSANLLYTMTEMGDAFVTLVLFNGAFVSMLFIAFQKPHPKWLGRWIIVLAILPCLSAGSLVCPSSG